MIMGVWWWRWRCDDCGGDAGECYMMPYVEVTTSAGEAKKNDECVLGTYVKFDRVC
jgi:hypothetical protein